MRKAQMRKALQRIIAICIVIMLCLLDTDAVHAAAIKDYCVLEHDGFSFTLDRKTITPKYYWTRSLWTNTHYDEVAIYYEVKEIANYFKNTKNKFNFKYDTKKNTLTFYPGSEYNKSDAGIKLKYTSAELKKNKGWGDDLAFDRGTKVYTNKKKLSAKAFMYMGGLYMQLEDIAKAANFGIARDEELCRYDISSNRAYKGIEAWTPDIAKIKTEIDIKPVKEKRYDEAGIIKAPMPNPEYIKNPVTREDFDKLIQYMIVNDIYECTIKTNGTDLNMLAFALEDIIMSSDYSGLLDDHVNGAIRMVHFDEEKIGENWAIKLSLGRYHGDYNFKGVAKETKKYQDIIVGALKELIASGELTADMTETERAKAVFNWICRNVEYDWESYLAGNIPQNQLEGALFKQLCVCDGYARLYALMCRYVGLYNTEYFSGEADGFLGRDRHAWNAQILDGKKVMTDATWCDTGSDFDEDGVEDIEYEWFARPISYFKKNKHYWDAEDYPEWK